ncbi:MAG: hypothetical protein ACRDHD_02095 [Candidatus Limnocylindria bacterium]
MQAFIVEGTNQAGELARQADAIAARGINIEAFSIAYGERGGTVFLAQDEDGVRAALTDAGFRYQEVPILTISLEDQPGMVASAAKRLADAGVNIELFLPVDFGSGRKATVAIGVDKIADARRALSDQLIDWTIPVVAVHAGSGMR